MILADNNYYINSRSIIKCLKDDWEEEKGVWKEEIENKVNRDKKAGNVANNFKSFAKALPNLHSTVSRVISPLRDCCREAMSKESPKEDAVTLVRNERISLSLSIYILF